MSDEKRIDNEMNMEELSMEEIDKVAGGMNGGVGTTSGYFMSATGTSLNLIVNWSVQEGAWGQRVLNVAVSTYSYAIGLDAMPGGVELKVNSMLYVANANAIDYRGEERAANLLAVFSVPITPGPQVIFATWHFNGTYSGTALGDVTASGVIPG
ncbi:MAG: hypothetical protein IJV14_01115 [Lachnospiraceae bacterium]|nr:hypothetical protein [Lachnospiraceae bacterium]